MARSAERALVDRLVWSLPCFQTQEQNEEESSHDALTTNDLGLSQPPGLSRPSDLPLAVHGAALTIVRELSTETAGDDRTGCVAFDENHENHAGISNA
jgi:hypothetical protein